MKDVLKIFEFTNVISKLKKIERFKGQFFWRDYPELKRYESAADHTWRLGILVILFADQLSQKINLEKALKMVLIHDLPEVLSGDESPVGEDGNGNNTYAFNSEKAEEKHIKEKEGAVALFKKLPPKLAKEFFNLWIEYEKQESFEARVIKSLDKIEATVQVLEYRQGHMFEEHLEFTRQYGLKGSEVDPAISNFGKFVIEELSRKYKKFKK